MSGRNWEPEDGMGFAGLVPTATEKSQERYDERQRQQMQQLRAKLTEAEAKCARLEGQIAELDAHNREIEAEMVAQSKDVRRYAWLKDRQHSVDFAYRTADDEIIAALLFDIGKHSVCADLDKTIDTAIALAGSSGDAGKQK